MESRWDKGKDGGASLGKEGAAGEAEASLDCREVGWGRGVAERVVVGREVVGMGGVARGVVGRGVEAWLRRGRMPSGLRGSRLSCGEREGRGEGGRGVLWRLRSGMAGDNEGSEGVVTRFTLHSS